MAGKKWTLDKFHSSMEFSIKHMMISTVRGKFNDFDAEIEGNPDDFSSMTASVTLKVASVNTGNQDRDNHLRSDDIFASKEHPEIRFKTKKIEGSGEDVSIVGDITIRGVTKEVTLKGEYGGRIKDPYGNDRFGLTASGSVNRQDFGVKWNMVLEGGGLMLGDKVNLHIALEAYSPPN